MAPVPRHNDLLESLAADDREAILLHMSDFDFDLGHVFGEPGEEIDFLYFPDHGIISAISMMRNDETVEAYMVGREGFTGSTAWLVPNRSSVRYVGQIAGRARRIDARKARELAAARPGIRQAFGRYDAALQIELEQSAPCNAVHRAEQRFAKWLLRAHDRADGDVLHMTQEFLANMLGAQRTTVNEGAQSLAAVGAIAYSRGKVTIADRQALERAACECYSAARAVADRRS